MELQVTPFLDARSLTLQMALQNSGAEDVFVDQFPLTYGWPPHREPYVYVHGDGLLLIHFGTVPNPPLMMLAQEIRFFSELLPAQRTFTTSLTLPLPILECGKVTPTNPEAPHEVAMASRLRLVICYKRKQRGTKVQELRPRGGIYDVRYANLEKVETTIALPAAIAARRRTDTFDRPFDPHRVMPP